MSPRRTDSAIRATLVETAARLLATEGPTSLTLRRVAHESGTSTMAIYTHFGGMPDLRRAVRREGFARLAARLAEIDRGADAVADLALVGFAYYLNATRYPDMYRVMFMEQPMDEEDAAAGDGTFQTLVVGVERCIADGRFADADAVARATELWVGTHGVVTLHLAACLPPDQAVGCLASMVRHLFTAYGDDPAKAENSIADALRRAELDQSPR